MPPLRRSRAIAGGVATGRRCGPVAQPRAVLLERGGRGPVVAERDRGLGAGDAPGDLRAVGVVVPGHGPGGEHEVVQPVGDEAAGRVVVAGLRAALQQQRRGGHGPAGDRDEVAREPALAALDRVALRVDRRDDGAGHGLAAERAHDGRAAQQLDAGRLDAARELAAGVRPQVGDGGDPHARGVQRQRRVEPAVAGRGHHRAAARLDGVERREPAGAAREHHAGQVVVREHERLLDRPGRRDVAAARTWWSVSPCQTGTSPSKNPSAGRAGEDLDAGRAGALGERPRPLVPAFVQQRAAGLPVLVAQHDVGAELRGPQRRAQPGDAAADHEHVAVAAAVLGAPAPVVLALGEDPEAGRVAQHLLVQRPQPARADERLVVEAGRRERAADDVGCAHDVEVEPGPGVGVRDREPVGHALGARAHRGAAADLHERVRALAAAAQLAARAVVLERAAERAPSGCVQRGRDRVALVRRDRLAVEREADRPRAVDPLAGLRGQAAHVTMPSPGALDASGVCGSAEPGASAGSAVHWTSLLRVSRSARNQARQPDRWNHHSRWTPATLRRK